MLEIRKVADRSKGERQTVLVYSPNDDDALEDGTLLIDLARVEQRLVNPDTPGFDHEPWPLKHAELVGDAPAEHGFADTAVARYMQDGFLTFKNMRAVFVEAGGKPYSRNPVLTGDEIVLDLKGKKLRYKVLEHPGRYEDDDGTVRETHEYTTKLVKGG